MSTVASEHPTEYGTRCEPMMLTTVEHHLYRFRRPLGSRLATFLPTMTVSHKPAAYGF